MDTLEPGFFLCRICRFGVPLDDIATSVGAPVCLHCYGRETGSSHPMPKPLRLHLISVLAGISG